MARIWSDEGKLERWLESSSLRWRVGPRWAPFPADAAQEIRAKAEAPSPSRVAEIEEKTHHDLAAFVDAVAETLGPEGRWFHYGLTSSDVVDTALALQLRAAGELILAGIDRALEAVVKRADEHRLTLTIGRTHGVHAEPTTFGLKLAVWAFELDRARGRVAQALEGVRVGKLSARSAITRRSIPRSSGSPASAWVSSPSPRRLRSSSATGTRSSWRRWPSPLPRSSASRPRSGTWRAPRSPRCRSRSARARRARRRCRTSATRSSPSGSADWRASSGRPRSSGSRTSPSGTSATSRTPRPSASRFPTRSSRSTTCSTGLPGSSRASSSGPSRCAGTSS